MCGAIAGGTAAAITTPLDVAKTRIMLAKASHSIRDLRIIVIGDCSGAGNQTCFSIVLQYIFEIPGRDWRAEASTGSVEEWEIPGLPTLYSSNTDPV